MFNGTNFLYCFACIFVILCTFAEDEHICSVERRTLHEGDPMVFPSYPVIFETVTGTRNIDLAEAGSKERLREEWGFSPVRLTSSNALSHGLKDATLEEYLDMMQEESETLNRCDSANETWYLFGNNESKEPFKTLAAMYELPSSQFVYEVKDESTPDLQDPTVVIGLGRRNSGLSFHFHGPGLSQAIIGKKLGSCTGPDFSREVDSMPW